MPLKPRGEPDGHNDQRWCAVHNLHNSDCFYLHHPEIENPPEPVPVQCPWCEEWRAGDDPIPHVCTLSKNVSAQS